MADLSGEIVEICRLLYDRRLTDSAGGNVSARDGGTVLVSPRYTGTRYRGRITRDSIVRVALDGAVLSGAGEPSREIGIHLRLYREFAGAGAVIHAHPQYTMVFASAGRPIPSAVEYADGFGTVQPVVWGEAHSDELARNVAAKMKEIRGTVSEPACCVLIPRHGVVAMGADLSAAYDAVERVETSARCNILSKLL
ncbi:MAG: class II aldolase/adducin family protein [bacterium]